MILSNRVASKVQIGAAISAMALLAGGEAAATAHEWTYDFSTGSLAGDWTFNTNNPAVVSFDMGRYDIATISKSASTNFHAAAQNDAAYALGIGDSLSISLAWAPFMTEASAFNNNEVFQFGVLSRDVPVDSDAAAGTTFSNGDGFWLSGREVESTTIDGAKDVWSTQKLDLWIHTDDTHVTNPIVSEYLGQIEIDSYREGSDGSTSTTFLSLELVVGLRSAGVFDYSVGVDAFEWTELGGSVSWVPEGTIFQAKGSEAHNLFSLGALHPSIGYTVSSSVNEGAQASNWTSVPVPEPRVVLLLLIAPLLLALRRFRS